MIGNFQDYAHVHVVVITSLGLCGLIKREGHHGNGEQAQDEGVPGDYRLWSPGPWHTADVSRIRTALAWLAV